MAEKNDKAKIQVTKNGPYIVSGNVPLGELIIRPQGKSYVYEKGRQFPAKETYALCRCGESKHAPYCDGTHEAVGFDGTETAMKSSYFERAAYQYGPEMDLMDDNRCAFARFCHREQGMVWDLVDRSDDPKAKEQAIAGAMECPAGRLVAVEKNGDMAEPDFTPSIDFLQDPERQASAGLYVRGNIPIVAADGEYYEPRNRVALCRCGHSRNKPFCNGIHVSVGYDDEIE